jgi:hypothetical protein
MGVLEARKAGTFGRKGLLTFVRVYYLILTFSGRDTDDG